MKFFRILAPGLVALALFLCTVPAVASDGTGAVAPDGGVMDGSDTPAPAGDDSGSGGSPLDGDVPAGDSGSGPAVSFGPVTCSGADVTVNLDNRSYASVVDVGGAEAPAGDNSPGDVPGDSSTLPDLLRAMFGEYTPRTQTVMTYFDGQLLDVSTEYVPGLAGLDVEWIVSVVLFGVVVYCLFRMLGGMVR